MTEKRRREAARLFKHLIDTGTIRKVALRIVRERFKNEQAGIARSTLYLWCQKFGISTR